MVSPPRDSSAGAEAVDLAATAGLILDDWQVLALEEACGERAGRWSAFEVGVVAPRQNGKGSILEARALAGLFLFDERLIIWSAHEFKALDVATPVRTPSGPTTMGALRDGDEVFGPDGQPTKVLKAHPWRFGRPCFELRFDDGQSVVADEDHLWQVYDSKLKAERVVTTGEIARDVVSVQPRTGRDRRTYRYRVALASPMQAPEADLPIDPWLFGAWLGDGTTKKGELTVGGEDLAYVLGRLDGLGESYRIRVDPRSGRVYSLNIAGLSRRLKALGVLGSKHIPECYLAASEPQRRALLAGIMDTDGTVSHQATVTMIKRDLMVQVVALVRGLGYKATLNEYRSSVNGRDAGPMWRVQFTARQAVNPFHLPRKAAKILPPQPSATRSQYNAIVACEPVASRPTRCITVAHESSCYLVADSVITHNTAKEAYLRVRRLIEDTPHLDALVQKYYQSNESTEIVLRSGARLKFLARNNTSARGFTGDCVILDEAFALTPDTMAAILPTMAAKSVQGNPQLWYTSSAGMRSSVQLRAVRKRAQSAEPGSLCWLEWSAPVEALDTPHDRRWWRMANPALGHRISEEFVASEYASMAEAGGLEQFCRERLGVFDEDEQPDAVFTAAQWQAVRSDDQFAGGVTFAVDIDPDREYAAIAAADPDGLVELGDYRTGTGWVADRLVELCGRHDATVVLHSAGPAASLQPQLEAAGITVRCATGPDLRNACGAMFDAVVQLKVRVRRHPALDAAATTAAKRPSGDAWVWDRRSGDVTPLVAATLAHWAAVTPQAAPAPVFAY